MKIKSILLISICVFALSCSKTQTEIKGEIWIKESDEREAKPLSGLIIHFIKKERFESLKNSKITINNADFSTTTDGDGKFSIKIPNGDYVATADYSIEREYLGKSYEIPFSWRTPFTASGGEQKIYMY